MFKKLFNRNRHRELNVSPSDFTFRGNVEGNGVNDLRIELTKRASQFSAIENAWLAKIQYATEDTVRIMLLVDSPSSSPNSRASIANGCADVITMDIMFADSLPAELIDQIKRNSQPLYIKNTNLYHCPIVVERGENASAPEEWIGAIVNLYVADTDHESALRRAAIEVRNDGYVFSGVHDNRVDQIDPEKWWDGHVLATWPEYADHFPSQTDIGSVVRCGGIFKGPVLGWDTETQQCK